MCIMLFSLKALTALGLKKKNKKRSQTLLIWRKEEKNEETNRFRKQ